MGSTQCYEDGDGLRGDGDEDEFGFEEDGDVLGFGDSDN